MHIMESDEETILIKKTRFSPICTLRFSAQEVLKSKVDTGKGAPLAKIITSQELK